MLHVAYIPDLFGLSCIILAGASWKRAGRINIFIVKPQVCEFGIKLLWTLALARNTLGRCLRFVYLFFGVPYRAAALRVNSGAPGDATILFGEQSHGVWNWKTGLPKLLHKNCQ
jgi:hypothetical protein